MENKNIQEVLVKGLKETRKLTYNFIEEVSLENLNRKLPRPGLDTFAKHIYEMALVQKAYTKVLKGKPLDFSEVEKITFGEEDYTAESKGKLVELLNDVDNFFRETIQNITDWNSEVELFGENIPKYGILELIIRHETLHHGQFIAFAYLLKIELPKSWVTAWALPTDKEE